MDWLRKRRNPPSEERMTELQHIVIQQIERIETRQNHELSKVHYMHLDKHRI